MLAHPSPHRRIITKPAEPVDAWSVAAGLVAALVTTLAAVPVVRADIDRWTNNGPGGGGIVALAIDPSTPSTLYAASRDGLIKSTGIHALFVDPNDPATVYAATADGVYAIQQSGATPTPTSPPTPTPMCADLVLLPTSGPPGTQVGASGLCYGIHSGRSANIYFDSIVVARVQGDTPGNYGFGFTVPIHAEPGIHVVRMTPNSELIGAFTSASFEVTGVDGSPTATRTPSPTVTPTPGGCGDVCDARPCVGRCPGPCGYTTSGICTVVSAEGCGCLVECPTPCATLTPTPTLGPLPVLAFELSVLPPRPMVGDSVALTFTISLLAGKGGLPHYSVSGTQPYFEGDISTISRGGPLGFDTVTYHLKAVQAGTAELQVHMTYEACPGDNLTCFFTGTVSPPLQVEIAVARTPTPTATHASPLGHSGCTIDPTERGGCGSGLFVFPLLLLLWRRIINSHECDIILVQPTREGGKLP